tara:strand:+ start:3547 stop:4779 length:1233 start_codon:yes stop_codon:yes gene_type:complete
MLRKNLRFSIIEGSWFALMFGLGENYLSAMAVYLGFSALQISILNSLPQLIGAFIQLGTDAITKLFKSTRSFVVNLSILQSILWVVLIIIINDSTSYYPILIWSIVYYSVSSIIGPAWISWMGYLVPLRIRSNYHANRNRIIHFIIFVSILFGGIILRVYEQNMIFAFSLMFSIGAFGRIISSYYLSKKNTIETTPSTLKINYRKLFSDKRKLTFISYNTFIHFSVMFLGPLFSIYILRTMELSYFVLTLCMVSWWLGNVFSSRTWGRLGKLKGNLFLLKISTLLMCILPAFWISVYYFGPNGRIIVSLIINLLAGISFSAFGLASFNIIYELCSEDDVIKFSALTNCLKGVGIFLGSLLAGLIVDSSYLITLLQDFNFTTIQLSMLISIVLRFASLFILTKLTLEHKNA